jgi:hypothetical protein
VTYRERRKQRGSDHYGVWREGTLISPEIIAGTTITAQLRKGNH